MNKPMGFTSDQVSRITGLTQRQLAYWDRTGFFLPELRAQRNTAFGRLYSFRDIVGLRTLRVLRHDHEIPLQELRKVGAWLGRERDTPWSSLRLFVSGRRVFFEEPQSKAVLAARPGNQVVFPVNLQAVAQDAEAAVARLKERSPSQIGKIHQNRYIAHNSPVVEGTRVPTSAIWNFSQAGLSESEILKEYPHLTLNDVLSALRFERSRREKAAS